LIAGAVHVLDLTRISYGSGGLMEKITKIEISAGTRFPGVVVYLGRVPAVRLAQGVE
jgi:hypothetical protein